MARSSAGRATSPRPVTGVGVSGSSLEDRLARARSPTSGSCAAGGDVAVGGPPPPQVEAAVEPRRRELDRRIDAAGSNRDRQPERRALDADAARAPARRAPRSARRRRRRSASSCRTARRCRRRPCANSRRAERRVAAVADAGPPDDRLVLRAGQRDVGEPQVLAALLDHVLLDVALEGPALRARRRSCAGPRRRVVEEDRLRVVRDPGRLPQERAVDDRELEALAAVDRQHLHRLGVGLEPPARSSSPSSRSASAMRSASQPRSAVDARAARRSRRGAAAGRRGAGRSAAARRHRCASTRAARPSPTVIASVSAATPLSRRTRPSGEGAGGPPPTPPRRRWRPARPLQPRNGVSAAVRARSGRGGPLERLEQPQPVARRRGGEHAAGAVDDRRDAARRAARRGPARRCALRADEHGDVPRADRLVVDRLPLGDRCSIRAPEDEQRDDVGGEVARRRARAPRPSGVAVVGQLDRRLVAVDDAHAQRGSAGRAGQPARPVGRRGLTLR